MKETKIIEIIGLFIGIVAIIFSIVLFSGGVGFYPLYETYNGDAYTGIQNAVVDSARNIYLLYFVVKEGFGYLLLTMGLTIICVSLHKIFEKDSEEQKHLLKYQNKILTQLLEKYEKRTNED